jgi:23S rRNA pseudouridine1911/1915/1917 synthase
MTAAVPLTLGGMRLDQALVRIFPQYSRNRLQAWLKSGHITIDGRRLDANHAVTGGEAVALQPPRAADAAAPQAQRMPLKVVFEDAALIVIDKPAGLVVHPGAGQPDRTLLNALLAHAPALAAVPRGGIVHRLDKDTSGLLVVAKTVEAQVSLVKQLADHSMRRVYLAVVQGDPPASGVIDAPVGRDVRARTRMAVTHRGKPSRTNYRVLERWSNAASRPAARTRSAFISSTCAIRWSATRPIGAARATASTSRARRCTRSS